MPDKIALNIRFFWDESGNNSENNSSQKILAVNFFYLFLADFGFRLIVNLSALIGNKMATVVRAPKSLKN